MLLNADQSIIINKKIEILINIYINNLLLTTYIKHNIIKIKNIL